MRRLSTGPRAVVAFPSGTGERGREREPRGHREGGVSRSVERRVRTARGEPAQLLEGGKRRLPPPIMRVDSSGLRLAAIGPPKHSEKVPGASWRRDHDRCTLHDFDLARREVPVHPEVVRDDVRKYVEAAPAGLRKTVDAGPPERAKQCRHLRAGTIVAAD